MSIDYFLFSKEKHVIINIYLKEIIDTYDALIQETKTQILNDNIYNKEEDIELFAQIKQKYEIFLKQNNTFCKSLKEISQKLCVHKYIIDLIDITPDRSSVIEYCEICGHTKE